MTIDGNKTIVTHDESSSKPFRRTISPYDLSASDNPGFVISQPALRGPNYDEWAASIRLALKARKKFGFADGTIPNPGKESDDYDDWCANHALVISWIKLTVDPTLRSNLTNCEVASDLWEHIRVRYSIKSGQRVQRLKTELATCRQKGMAVEAYYGKLMKLWTSLKDYQRAKTMEEVLKEREEDMLHQFLMGLDETLYGSVKSALLSRIPLPTLDEAYNAVAQDEEPKPLAGYSKNDQTELVLQCKANNLVLETMMTIGTNQRLALSAVELGTLLTIASVRSDILLGGESVLVPLCNQLNRDFSLHLLLVVNSHKWHAQIS